MSSRGGAVSSIPRELAHAQHDDGFAFVGAVHRLLRSDRQATKADLLLAAVMQALYEQDRDLGQIRERIKQFWPGAPASTQDIAAALQLGTELRLLAMSKDLLRAEVWTLTKLGVDDVQQHETWVEQVRDQAVREVVHRADSGLGERPTEVQARLWLDTLVRALAAGIRASRHAYLGEVESIIGGRVAPRNIDRDRVLAELGPERGGGETTDFLRSLALTALDPLDDFGNDLVSHITTGCILHAYVADVDRKAILSRVGRPRKEMAILDTPVLLEILGPRRVSSGVVDIIKSAVGNDWSVVVLEHSLEELIEVLERDLPRIENDLRAAHANGSREEWYARLVNEQLPALAIESVREGRYKNLPQLLEKARSLGDELVALGVTVRPAGNHVDVHAVKTLERSLTEELDGIGRSPHVILRDAETMAVAWRRRRKQVASKWPGAWIVTRDRKIGPAYLHSNPRDRVTLTVTVAQWATLLSISVPEPDVAALAEAAANQFVEEAIWSIPARYPSDVALDLARQLSPSQGGSDTDLGFAQLSLDEVLAEDERLSSTAVASAVLAARAKRVNRLARDHASRASDRIAAEQSRAVEADGRAAEARASAQDAVGSLVEAQRQLREQQSAMQWTRTQLRRVVISSAVMMLAVAGAVAALLLAGPLFGTLSLVGLVVVAVTCVRWCRKVDASFTGMIIGSTVVLVGLAADLLSFADRL